MITLENLRRIAEVEYHDIGKRFQLFLSTSITDLKTR